MGFARYESFLLVNQFATCFSNVDWYLNVLIHYK